MSNTLAEKHLCVRMRWEEGDTDLHSWSLVWVTYVEAAAPLVSLEASEGGSGDEGYQVSAHLPL